MHAIQGLNYEGVMGILESFPIVVVLILTVILMLLRSRWAGSHWRIEQLSPIEQIDELARIMAGLHRRANRRGDPRNAAITEWVEPFMPMIQHWEIQKHQLRKQASFRMWIKAGMPKQLIPDYRSATLQLHARSAVAPVLAQFNAGPVVLESDLGDHLWRALNVDLPERVSQSVGVPSLSQT